MGLKRRVPENTRYERLVKGMPNPKPCPCCGNKNLYVGHMSSTSVGVHCINLPPHYKGCGLRIWVDFMSDEITTPKGYLRKGIPHGHEAERYMLKLAIKRWGRRVK